MKKKLLIISITIILFIIIAVSVKYFFIDKEKNIEPNINVSQMQEEILKLYGNDMPNMTSLDDIGLKEIYNIDISNIDSMNIQIPMINIRVNEISIIKVKNNSDISFIKDKFKERANKVASTFENYLSDQYEIAKNPLIKSRGNYVVMIMSDKKDEIEKTFDSFFDKK
jgi:hypothetical protein